MWWTIGLIVLGGLLISGLVMIASTNVRPKMSEKANALIKPYVTHTAYAWSADGTDRFTTTKPNLNLFDRTSDKTSSITGDNWNIAIIGVYEKPKVGQEYTISVEVPEADHPVSLGVWRWDNEGHRVGPPITHKWGINPGEKVNLTFTWTDPGNSGATHIGADLAWVNLEWTTNNTYTGTYSYRKAKLEIGNKATPWTPSASEVKPSDQPKYIGTYTDKSKTDSQDPKKYTWELNPEYHE